MMKRLSLALMAMVLLTRCGVIGEAEAPEPVVKLGAQPVACTFPEKFDEPLNVVQAVDCLEINVQNAFASLQGEQDGELSMAELKKLQEKGILKFAVGNPNQWNGLSGLLSLLHPEGKSALSRQTLFTFLAWVRGNAAPIADLVRDNLKGESAPIKPKAFFSLVDLADGFVNFVSDRGTLTLEQLQALAALAQTNEVGPKKSMAAQISAAWTLKALVLEATRAGDDIRGASLKSFLSKAVTIARAARATFDWWETDFHPARVSSALSYEWTDVIRLAKEYFRETATFDLSNEELTAQIQVLLPGSGLAERIPDLVSASRRLLDRAGDSHRGLVYGLLHLFDGFDAVATSIHVASKDYSGCKAATNCRIPLRTVLDNPSGKRVAMVSAADWSSNANAWERHVKHPTSHKRRDHNIAWKTVLERFIERGVMINLFNAFDSDLDGSIPYTGKTPEDIREATDVAYTLITLMNAPATAKNGGPPLFIKPSTLIGVIGLMGDAWVLPGNNDGKIDIHEFYSAVKVYADISRISSESGLKPVYSKDQAKAFERETPAPDDVAYLDRQTFIQGMARAYAHDLPYLVPVFQHLENTTKGSRKVVEAIVPKQSEPIVAWRYGAYKEGDPISSHRLTDYLERKDTLRPVALMVLLDRAILKCDTNEDELFNWKEMDCVVPLMLEAGKQLIRSDLFALPLFAGDGSFMALEMLGKKGLPLALTKTILLNGSVRDVHLSKKYQDFVKNKTTAGPVEFARQFENVSKDDKDTMQGEMALAITSNNNSIAALWSYGTGARYKDYRINGVDQWDGMGDTLIKKGILPNLVKSSDGVLSQEGLEAQWEKVGTSDDPKYRRVRALHTLLPLSFVLGVGGDIDWKVVIGENNAISPGNILRVLDSTLQDAPK